MAPATLGKLALCVIVFVGALGLITWRQSRAFEVNQELAELHRRVSVALAERVSLERQIQVLESRSHVVPIARSLGMHTAEVDEQVWMPVEVTP